ncbi:MAG: MBL fold metallo-hydrolase [Syntrophomonadaceae bacterium]|jgi:phosphoribosyl 1,2-cyclic phosphodiesterase
MQIHILASGSSGNAVFIELGGCKLLIDAGISARRIERGLAAVGVRAGDLDGVLITHEHSDHIQGLDVLIRRHHLPVYARPATWSAIPCRSKLPGSCCLELEETLEKGPVYITPFSISHDAADPVGFCFYYRNYKWVLATDLGVVTPNVREALTRADAVVLEANHDVEMLQKGPYPQFLKQRIKSKVGHLSNFDAAQLLATIPRQPVMEVFLAHLSQKNNHWQLAENTVLRVLKDHGLAAEEEIKLHRTYPDATASLVNEM